MIDIYRIYVLLALQLYTISRVFFKSSAHRKIFRKGTPILVTVALKYIIKLALVVVLHRRCKSLFTHSQSCSKI